MIVSKNNSKIIQSGKNSNIVFANNIALPGSSINFLENIIENKPKPGDLVTCPDGHSVLVDDNGNYFCDIDPNGDGLYPYSTVTCKNGTTTVDIHGNIVGGCTPINKSIVTCYSGITATVENGTWSCAQGEDDIRTYQFIGENSTYVNRHYISLQLFRWNNQTNDYDSEGLSLFSPFTVDMRRNSSGNLNEYATLYQYRPIGGARLFTMFEQNQNILKQFFYKSSWTRRISLENYNNYLIDRPIINLPSGTYRLSIEF